MRQRFPIVHIGRLVESASRRRTGEGLRVDRLRETIRRLSESGAQTPAVAMIAAGFVPLASIETPFVFLSTDVRRAAVATWCDILAPEGFASILACSIDDLGAAETVDASDLPVATGSGIAVASRGASGVPLVGLSVGELRRELTESRRKLSEAVGYPVRMLAPHPTAAGRGFDGLVLREARRAGYSLFLRPGGLAKPNSAAPSEPLPYRSVDTKTTPDELLDWIAGGRIARGKAELRRLVQTPRRLLDRLAPSND